MRVIIAEHLIIGPERALEANTKRLREQCESSFSLKLPCERRPDPAGFIHEALDQNNEAALVLEPVVTKVSAGQGQNARGGVSDPVRC
ncbi:MAG: hypothetical protein NTY84_14900 [Verrucomicrobia bacterium]|nr:hypothetical protein [Verrucomicrobiota bacterium]